MRLDGLYLFVRARQLFLHILEVGSVGGKLFFEQGECIRGFQRLSSNRQDLFQPFELRGDLLYSRGYLRVQFSQLRRSVRGKVVDLFAEVPNSVLQLRQRPAAKSERYQQRVVDVDLHVRRQPQLHLEQIQLVLVCTLPQQVAAAGGFQAALQLRDLQVGGLSLSYLLHEIVVSILQRADIRRAVQHHLVEVQQPVETDRRAAGPADQVRQLSATGVTGKRDRAAAGDDHHVEVLAEPCEVPNGVKRASLGLREVLQDDLSAGARDQRLDDGESDRRRALRTSPRHEPEGIVGDLRENLRPAGHQLADAEMRRAQRHGR